MRPAAASRSSCRASTRRSRTACSQGAREALAEARCATTTSTLVHVPGAFEIPVAALRAGRDRAVRRRHLPRLPDQGRHDALRIHRRRRPRRHHGRRRGHRRAGGVRRADDADRRAGGWRAPPTGQTTRGAKRRWRRWRWPRCSAQLDGERAGSDRADAERPRCADRAPRSRGIARAKPRCRCSISGRSAGCRSTRCARRSGRTVAGRRRAADRRSMRAFATTLADGVAGTRRDDSIR